jgi:hypothetical protein
MSERTRNRRCRGLTEGWEGKRELADGLLGEQGDGLGLGQVARWIARMCLRGGLGRPLLSCWRVLVTAD